MADIFDEIEEELKQDRLNSLWAKYGKYLIGLQWLLLRWSLAFRAIKAGRKMPLKQPQIIIIRR